MSRSCCGPRSPPSASATREPVGARRSRRPAAISIESRIASASSRFFGMRHKSALSGSIAAAFSLNALDIA